MEMQRIYSTKSDIESIGIQRHFTEHNIPFRVIDKTDSSYASMIGDIEFFVEEEYVEKSKAALELYFKD